MSTIPVTFRHGVERVRVRASADVLAVGALTLLVLLLVAVTWNTWGDLSSDTGYDVVAGERVANGELPYRDFVYYYGPLAPTLAALANLVAGDGITAAVALGLVLTALILAATYAVARRLVSPLGAFLATAITAGVAFIPDNYSYVLPHTFAATLGILGLLVLLLCIVRYAESGGVAFLVGAGSTAGLLTLTKPEPMLAAFVAAGVWLVLRRRAGENFRREVTLFGIPALAVPMVVYGALSTAVSPRDLLLENLYPVDMLRAGGDRLVEVRMPLTFSSLIDAVGRLALYAVGVAVLLLAARALGSARWRRAAVIGCASAATLIVLASVAKPDVLRGRMSDLWGWIPAAALGAAALVVYRRYRQRDDVWSPRSQLELATVVTLAVVAFTTYGAFAFNGWRPQMAVYYAPLAAIFVARIHLVELGRTNAARTLAVVWVGFLAAALVGLTMHRARDEAVTVHGAEGALAAPPSDAAVYQGAVDAIERNTVAGEPIFTAPLLTGLHLLTGRPSPLNVISTLPSALPTTSDQLAAIKRLDEAGVRLAVIDTRDWIGYGQSRFGESFDRTIAHWLESHFMRLQVIRGTGDEPRVLEIWKRREG